MSRRFVCSPEIVAVLVAWWLSCISLPVRAEQQLQVIVNASVAEAQLSQTQLRRIFTMRQRQWANGEPIAVHVLSDNNAHHQQFCKAMLGLFPYQLERLWNKRIYAGIGDGPIRIATLEQLQTAIAETPGAIGYMPIGPSPSGSKAIQIEGATRE